VILDWIFDRDDFDVGGLNGSKESIERRCLAGAGEAGRLLHRSGDADQVEALREGRRRAVAEGVREGRLQERDPREGSADQSAGS